MQPGIVLCILTLIYLFSASGRIGLVDAEVMIRVSRSMLQGSLAISDAGLFTVSGVNGHHYSYFGLLPSIWYLPFILLGRALAHLIGLMSVTAWEEFLVSFSSVPLASAILWYLLTYWRRQQIPNRQICLGLWLVGLCTSLWPYAKLQGSDLMMALGLLAAVIHGFDFKRPGSMWLSGMWLGVALLARKQAQISAPLILLYLTYRTWRLALPLSPFQSTFLRPMVWLLAGLTPPVLITLIYNYIRHGSPFSEPNPLVPVPWEMPAVSEAAKRLMELSFLSSRRALVIYNLVAVLMFLFAYPRWRRHPGDRDLPLLIIALLVVNLLFFMGTWFWGSGVSYGSRYLLFLVPLFALGWGHISLPLRRWQTYTLGLGTAWGVWLALMGVLIDPNPAQYRHVTQLGGRGFFPYVYALESARMLDLKWGRLPPELESHSELTHFAFKVPDLWWVHIAEHLKARMTSPSDPTRIQPATAETR